ncbi:MAG TPA: hypothetical protein ACHBX0_04730 [Arsenophonus sp.]
MEQHSPIKPQPNDWTIEKVNILSCLKLVVYIDYALAKNHLAPYSNKSVITKNNPFILDSSAEKDIQTLLIHSLLTTYQLPLIDTMKNHECYWITRYLLNQLKQNVNNIMAIRLKYGVLETHFRRLCH